jgi:DNA invertase Pin-like site-specific DNA recombinase
MPTTKAIGYCRISTEKQLDGVSLENQQGRIAAYCAYKGFELTRTITDEAISGAKNKDRLSSTSRIP